jgi:hypothetical protein
MRYSLRTLLTVLALGPPVLAAIGFMLYWKTSAALVGALFALIGGLFIWAMWRGKVRYEHDETRKWP